MQAVIQRRLFVTPEGHAALERGGLPLRSLDLLQAVQRLSGKRGRRVQPTELKRTLGPRFRTDLLEGLLGEGLLTEEAATRTVGAKVEELVLPASPAADPGAARGPRQHAVLSLLRDFPEGFTSPDLLRRTGTSRSSLRSLQARGLLVIETKETPRRPIALELEGAQTQPIHLSAGQRSAFETINARVAR